MPDVNHDTYDHSGVPGVGLTWTPVNEAYIVNGVGYSATADLTVEATSLPSSGVVLVTGFAAMSPSITAVGNDLRIRNYSASDGQGLSTVVYGPVSGRADGSAFAVEPGGTNGREIRYKVSRASGTLTVYIMVNGYWAAA